MKLLFIILTLIVAASIGSAAPLSNQARLKRMSRFLTDLDPTWQDYMDLKACNPADKSCIDTFFGKKLDSYISSPNYTQKFVTKLSELFSLNSDPERISLDMARSAMFRIFQEIIYLNLSWDELLLRKTYNWIDSQDNSLPESDFYYGVMKAGDGEGIKGSRGYRLTGAPNDPRLAGVLTTSTFNDRFSVSMVNLNFKRAAAVFRIFLCDDMKAMVLPDETPAGLDRVLTMALGEIENKKKEAHFTAATTTQGRHASDPKCQSCHYKLDPVGATFGGMGLTLSSVPAQGALRYTGNGGRDVKIPVRGIGELALALTKQPEYAQCQVKFFWKMLMPTEAPLTDEKMTDLVSAFDRFGRKPNTFVKYLTGRPEFYDAEIAYPKNLPLYTSYIKPTLQRCNSCHAGGKMMVPDLTKLPLGGTQQSHDFWISKIKARLDVDHDGANRTMPPRNSGWDLNPELINKFKEWIKAGGVEK